MSTVLGRGICECVERAGTWNYIKCMILQLRRGPRKLEICRAGSGSSLGRNKNIGAKNTQTGRYGLILYSLSNFRDEFQLTLDFPLNLFTLEFDLKLGFGLRFAESGSNLFELPANSMNFEFQGK